MPVPGVRTLASSKFKEHYSDSAPPAHYRELFDSTLELLIIHCRSWLHSPARVSVACWVVSAASDCQRVWNCSELQHVFFVENFRHVVPCMHAMSAG